MITEPMSIDTLDVIVTVIGAVVAMVVMFSLEGTFPGIAGSDFTDYAIGLSAFALLTIKRTAVPTRHPPTDVSPVLRMVYLLCAILGALGLLSAVAIVGWGDALGVAQASAVQPGVLGGVFMAVAVFIERVLFVD